MQFAQSYLVKYTLPLLYYTIISYISLLAAVQNSKSNLYTSNTSWLIDLFWGQGKIVQIWHLATPSF